MNARNSFIYVISFLLFPLSQTTGKDLSTSGVSVKYITVSEDSWVSKEAPEENYNSITDLECGNMDTDTLGSREIFLKFDLHGLEKGEIISAKLEIKSDQKFDQGWTRADSFYIEVFGTGNGWSEETINWDNKPAILTGPLAEKNITRETVYTLKGSLIDFVNQSLVQEDSIISLAIKGKHETPGSRIWVSDKGWVPARLKLEIEEEKQTLAIQKQVAETNPKNHLLAFPNPCSKELVQVNVPGQGWQFLQLTNLTGQVLTTRPIWNEKLITINTRQLIPGHYLVYLIKDKHHLSTKLVVN